MGDFRSYLTKKGKIPEAEAKVNNHLNSFLIFKNRKFYRIYFKACKNYAVIILCIVILSLKIF